MIKTLIVIKKMIKFILIVVINKNQDNKIFFLKLNVIIAIKQVICQKSVLFQKGVQIFKIMIKTSKIFKDVVIGEEEKVIMMISNKNNNIGLDQDLMK